jgi:hypothetical protein
MMGGCAAQAPDNPDLGEVHKDWRIGGGDV